MGMCYVLHPIHEELKEVLHSWSHQLEFTVAVQEETHAQMGLGQYSAAHLLRHKTHEHSILDVFEALLKGEESSNTDDEVPVTKDVKLDKHIRRTLQNQNQDNTFVAQLLQKAFLDKQQAVHKGYVNLILQPPNPLGY